MRLRHEVLFVVLVMAATSCSSTTDTGSALPESGSWLEENPQPSDGTTLHLTIAFIIDHGFDGETVEVRLDGELVVSGTGNPDPDEHFCWYGAYPLIVDAGTHEIAAITGSGESFAVSFDLTGESTGNVIYRHPSADSELDQPELSWQLSEGPPLCA